jgi:hypothetical protein
MWSLENRDIQKNKGNDGNDDEEKETERGCRGCRSNINKKCSRRKSFNPKARRRRGLNKQCVEYVIYGAEQTFIITISRRCIWAREAKKYVVREKQTVVVSVTKFSSVVTFNKANW